MNSNEYNSMWCLSTILYMVFIMGISYLINEYWSLPVWVRDGFWVLAIALWFPLSLYLLKPTPRRKK